MGQTGLNRVRGWSYLRGLFFFKVTLCFSVAYFKKSSGLSEGCPAQLLRGLALLEQNGQTQCWSKHGPHAISGQTTVGYPSTTM